MCVIIVKPAGIKLDRSIYETCFENNGHGAGLCYIKDDELVIKKGFDKFAKLYDTEIAPNEERELIIHFRVASAGMTVDAKNCHPFKSERKRDEGNFTFALVHNGTLTWRSTKDHSDTSCFNYDFMRTVIDRDPWYFDIPINVEVFERGVLDHGNRLNKMVILRYDSAKKESKTYILNKQKGENAHGCWFSNTSYLPKPKVNPREGLWLGYERYMQRQNNINTYNVHRYVKNKWLPPQEWMTVMRVARAKKDALVGPEKLAWSLLGWNDQTKLIEKEEGFFEVVVTGKQPESQPKPWEKKQPDKSVFFSKKEAFTGVERHSPKMKWLTDEERRLMTTIANKHCRDAEGVDATNWSNAEEIDWMRDDYKSFEPGCKELTVAQLDKYIIALYLQEAGSDKADAEAAAKKDQESERARQALMAMGAEGGFYGDGYEY